MSYDKIIAEMRDEIRALKARMDQRPVIQTVARSEYLVVRVVSGQTLGTGQTGIKYKSSPITSVPSAYDPNVTSTFIDGIGRGTLFVNGIQSSGYVLLLNDSTCSISRALLATDWVSSYGPTSMPVDGGGYVNIYKSWFL